MLDRRYLIYTVYKKIIQLQYLQDKSYESYRRKTKSLKLFLTKLDCLYWQPNLYQRCHIGGKNMTQKSLSTPSRTSTSRCKRALSIKRRTFPVLFSLCLKAVMLSIKSSLYNSQNKLPVIYALFWDFYVSGRRDQNFWKLLKHFGFLDFPLIKRGKTWVPPALAVTRIVTRSLLTFSLML